jgi:hypothetical protein
MSEPNRAAGNEQESEERAATSQRPSSPVDGTTGRSAAGWARKIALVENADLAAAVDACRSVIRDRFPDDDHHGAAAMLLDDGTILTGTAPDAINPSVEVCHETEPYCAAFRLASTSSRRCPCIESRVAFGSR